ncbi:leucine-rich repeat extensin-like protein 3 [Iris pallida]|uniref:Leucine-rich repeat extensin-like protein 3 n=1 Tax=Iris pallida TaxID=29817 RepID=A0AAX6H4S3_IRIPA|nr:leucine-rich repeat extensin-like protein 3 [Iris pallida]
MERSVGDDVAVVRSRTGSVSRRSGRRGSSGRRPTTRGAQRSGAARVRLLARGEFALEKRSGKQTTMAGGARLAGDGARELGNDLGSDLGYGRAVQWLTDRTKERR